MTLREIAEPPNFTLDADLELEGAFRFLEEQDLERVPVVEGDGRLVGVLSRAVVQRRLAETEPFEDERSDGEPPEGERAAWKAFFDHYVFRPNGHPLAHLPGEKRGILGRLADNYGRIRAHVMRTLRGDN